MMEQTTDQTENERIITPKIVSGVYEVDERSKKRDLLITRRLEEIAERLQQQDSFPLQPRVALLADKNHILDQQIDFVLDTDLDQIRIQLKLPLEQSVLLHSKIESRPEGFSEGRIVYGKLNSNEKTFFATNTLYKDYGDIHLHISKAEIDGTVVNSALGLIQMNIPLEGKDCKSTLVSLTKKIDFIFSNEIGIDDWITQPTKEDQNVWMLSRYSEQRRTKPDSLDNPEGILEQLEAKEVLPEYWTPVTKERHKQLKEQYGEYAIYHNFGMNQFINLARTGATYSSHERMRRGLMIAGNSTYTDFVTGGAEGVFTRTISEKALSKKSEPYKLQSFTVVVDPQEFNRTDMYAYPWDWYGSRDALNERMTPDELLLYLEEHGMESYKNEQIFNRGTKIKAFAVPIEKREEALQILREQGITKMNGIPIEKCVIAARDEYDLIDISWGREPRSIKQI